MDNSPPVSPRPSLTHKHGLSTSPSNLNQMIQMVSDAANKGLTIDAQEAAKHALPSLLTLANTKQLQQLQEQSQQLINNNYNKQNLQQQNVGLQQVAQASSSHNLSTGSKDDQMNQSKRSRTQLTNGQVNAMQATFELYRSPSLAECEILGNGIGLARRVVQVI
jgi:hypothetical protein